MRMGSRAKPSSRMEDILSDVQSGAALFRLLASEEGSALVERMESVLEEWRGYVGEITQATDIANARRDADELRAEAGRVKGEAVAEAQHILAEARQQIAEERAAWEEVLLKTEEALSGRTDALAERERKLADAERAIEAADAFIEKMKANLEEQISAAEASREDYEGRLAAIQKAANA